MGITGIQRHSPKRTTVADPDAPLCPDLIKRDFTGPVPTIKLVGDITYPKISEGRLYPAIVIDLCTRMVVGWAMADGGADIFLDLPKLPNQGFACTPKD